MISSNTITLYPLEKENLYTLIRIDEKVNREIKQQKNQNREICTFIVAFYIFRLYLVENRRICKTITPFDVLRVRADEYHFSKIKKRTYSHNSYQLFIENDHREHTYRKRIHDYELISTYYLITAGGQNLMCSLW